MAYRVYILLVFLALTVFAQNQTVGLFFHDDRACNGYTLFAPIASINTYLIDINGELVHSWSSDNRPGLAVYLLPNSNLLRCEKISNHAFRHGGGAGGRVVEYEWDGTKVWEYTYSDSIHILHHDIEIMPNGNILMIAWERKTYDEAIEAGRNPQLLKAGSLWPDHIIEVKPEGSSGGDIVWEWHIWDHLIQDYDSTKANFGVIKEQPELMDINYVPPSEFRSGLADWNHTNSIDYNEQLDQILLSLHGMSEIIIIDHSTTTEEAAGHSGGRYGKGGDILYRWGNPQTYRSGNPGDQVFFLQHDAQWIEKGMAGEGGIIVFNNGNGRSDIPFSSVDIIKPEMDKDGNYLSSTIGSFLPDESSWMYTTANESDFYSHNLSGCQRLYNGNTLICSGANGYFFEVTNEREVVWIYVNPVVRSGPLNQGDIIPRNPIGFENNVFRVLRYSPDYPGFENKDLSPKGTIEGYVQSQKVHEPEGCKTFILMQNYPNPFNPFTTIRYSIGIGVGANNHSPLQVDLSIITV